jgi:TolA-binding protein
MAQALLGEGRPAEALDFLQPVAAMEPDSVATFLLGRAQAVLGRCAEARTAFDAYAAAHPGSLGAHARAALADCLLDTGHAAEAVSLLEAVAHTQGVPRLQSLEFRERLARARVRAGDLQTAGTDYESLLAGARTNSYRAELNYDLGVLADDPTAAAARFRTAVSLDPRGPAARAALDELVALGDPFAASLEAADTRFEQSRYREALAAYSAVLQRGDAGAGRAQYGRGVALVRLGQDRAGIAELESIARLAPDSAEAADGMFRAGRIRESLADLDGAAAAYGQVLGQPNSGSRTADAEFRLAFVRFQQGDLAAATAGWRDLAGRVSAPDELSQAAYWLGKALHAAGDEDAARRGMRDHLGTMNGYYLESTTP